MVIKVGTAIKDTRIDLYTMKLSQIACVEEGNDAIKRSNKAMQIEREFREKKLTTVLTSNKETNKVITDNNKNSFLLQLAIIFLFLFIVTPIALSLVLYFESNNLIQTSTTLAEYVSKTSDFNNEIAQTYNSMLLLSLIHE